MNAKVVDTPKSRSRRYITSPDRTVIGYESIGEGPGLVLVQGAMGTVQNYYQLADCLAAHFKVYLPERRGRGISPKPYEKHHCIADDVADLRSIVDETGAEYLFGLSSGAMIVLAALMDGICVTKAVVYEPPFYLEGMAIHLVRHFNHQIEVGRYADALVTAAKIVGLGSPCLNSIPLWLQRLGARFALMTNAGRPDGYVSIKTLVPAMRYDFNIVLTMNEQIQNLRNIRQEVLLMGGDKSPGYLKNALTALELVLPDTKRINLAGADHSTPWNTDLSGRPLLVAQCLISYLR
ncbi:alpha/beta hydrolase [Pseudomonas sp. MWU16-30317]|uniref:alpha/beta fold hydrolase n=1 Tax=Pseudomonas sp. MWU16-30317 TaxID=2878095 RepID=UPI001CFB7908|nr:alpha/beta hydrolase [Pseudomonas sp. MWU16-30317]